MEFDFHGEIDVWKKCGLIKLPPALIGLKKLQATISLSRYLEQSATFSCMVVFLFHSEYTYSKTQNCIYSNSIRGKTNMVLLAGDTTMADWAISIVIKICYVYFDKINDVNCEFIFNFQWEFLDAIASLDLVYETE